MEITLDKAALLEKVFGDKSMLSEIIDMFLQMAPDMVSDVEKAIQCADDKALVETAHFLKGSIGNFHEGEAFEAALELEKLGRSANLQQAPEIYQVLLQEVRRLTEALEGLKSEINV